MSHFFRITALLFSGILWSQSLVINELNSDSNSTDTEEFIELKSANPNTSTDGYILVFFNGSTNGGDSSYFAIDLNGYVTDSNGLLTLGNEGVSPFPQVIFSDNTIQNGADAVAIYQTSINDFPDGTLATQANLIDALVYDTDNADDTVLLGLLGETVQYNETEVHPRSLQRQSDGTFIADSPTPRQLNDGSGTLFNGVTISTSQTQYNEGDSFDITFTTDTNVTSDLVFNISLSNEGFSTADFTGNTSITITSGQNTASTSITLIDDADDEGDEVLQIQFLNLMEPIVASNNQIDIRVVDNDFTVASWGTPLAPTFNNVTSTQPTDYYTTLDGKASTDLETAIQDIIADPTVVRAQTYADVFTILQEADQNPLNSNEVWLVYSEIGRSKLDMQTSGSSAGKWNREHTFPRSRAGYDSIEEDDISDGINVFWTTEADSLRHGNSDAHALRAADAGENSSRGNMHYGQYEGPTGNSGSFKGDVARSVLYLQLRYNGLSIENGFPSVTGQLGDLQTLLEWHRNDPPDDFEMNRNNVIYEWQKNRNPLIDQPLLVEYIWGNQVGETWSQSLSVDEELKNRINIFPNPTSNVLYIKGIDESVKVDIYSIDGKLLKTIQPKNNTIPLNLSPSVYLLKIQQGQASIVKRIIVK